MAAAAADPSLNPCNHPSMAADRLPTDILQTIQRSLPLVDYLRFPAVCTAWCSAARDQGNIPRLPRDPPWLFGLSRDQTALYGVDPLSEIGAPRVYRFSLPDHLCPNHLFTSVGHWLLFEEIGSLSGISLFNPFSSQVACLPPSAALPPPSAVAANVVTISFINIHTIVTDTNCGIALAVVSGGSCTLAYIRLDCNGDNSDNIIPVGSWIDLSHLISDTITAFSTAAFYKASLFCAVDHTGNKVVAFDFSRAPTVRQVDMTFNLPNNYSPILGPADFCCYQQARLVNSGSSLFLVRWRITLHPDGASTGREIDVYRLDGDAGANVSKEWVPVDSLGDLSFFFGNFQSFSMSTADFPELKSNRIYLPSDPTTPIAGNSYSCHYDFETLRHHLVYNLEDKSWGSLFDDGLSPLFRYAYSAWMVPPSLKETLLKTYAKIKRTDQMIVEPNLRKSSVERNCVSSGKGPSRSMGKLERESTLKTKLLKQLPLRTSMPKSSDSKNLNVEASLNVKGKVSQGNNRRNEVNSEKDVRTMKGGEGRVHLPASRSKLVADSSKEEAKQSGASFSFKSNVRTEQRRELKETPLKTYAKIKRTDQTVEPNLRKSLVESNWVSSGKESSRFMGKLERESTLKTKLLKQLPLRTSMPKSSDSKNLNVEASLNVKGKVSQGNNRRNEVNSEKDVRTMKGGEGRVHRPASRSKLVADSSKEEAKQSGASFSFKSDVRTEKRRDASNYLLIG